MGGLRRGDCFQDFALSHVTHQAQEHTESTAVAVRESESGNFWLLQKLSEKAFSFRLDSKKCRIPCRRYG